MNRIISMLAKLLLTLLLLLLTAFLSFWVRNLHFIEGTDEQDMAYLSQNKQDLNLQLSEAGPEAALFDSAFYESQVFLLGENHGYADVQLIDRQLLLHLNMKAGLRYYLAEMDSIRAKKLNTFLTEEAKDTLLLKQVVKDISIRIPQQSSEELYQKWLAIYDFNKKLPDSLKIIVIGVDQNFEDTSCAISRDSMMLVNFKNAVKAKGLEKEKFYGLFGYTHVLQSGYGEKVIHPFAAKVKRSDLPFANRIQSIVCFTLDSDMALPKTNQFPSPPDEKTSLFNSDGPFVLVKGIEDLKEITKENTATLFHLDNTGSPYRRHQKLAGIKVNLPGNDILPNNARQKTTAFFQHAVLIRNSKALHRLKAN